jgi:hypothetical protein
MPDEPERSPPDKRAPRSGISPETLVIAAAASVAASFLIARIWGPGTLFGAAAAPVIVALVSAGLQRPVAAVRGTVEKDAETVDPAPDTPSPPAGLPRTAGDDGARLDGHRDSRWGRWRWGLITGLAGFLIAVAIITVPDLLTGSSITGNGRPTTFFGAAPKRQTVTRTATPTTPTTSASQTTIARTVTVTTSTTSTHPATSTTTTATPSTTTAATAGLTSTLTTVTAASTPAADTSSTATTVPTTATGPDGP